MGTPDFIIELRKHIGHDLLWLAGATAVVVRYPGSAGDSAAAAAGSSPASTSAAAAASSSLAFTSAAADARSTSAAAAALPPEASFAVADDAAPSAGAGSSAAVPAGIHPRYAHAAILLVRRSDNGAWTPITGIVDPGEHPATTAEREAREEAGVQIRVLRLAQVAVTKPVTFANGDRTQFIDHTFECEWLGGEARVADEENTDVRWVAVRDLDAVAGVAPHMRRRIEAALSGESAARMLR